LTRMRWPPRSGSPRSLARSRAPFAKLELLTADQPWCYPATIIWEGWMRRREFIAALGGAAVWPVVAEAQPARIARIGFLDLAPASAWTNEVAAFRAGLRDLGYEEGKNIVIEFRWADNVDQLPELAAELVRLKVDLIIAPASTEVEPVRQA